MSHLRTGVASLAGILVGGWIWVTINPETGLIVGLLLLAIVILWDVVSSKKKKRFPNVPKSRTDATPPGRVVPIATSPPGMPAESRGGGSVGIHIEGGSDVELTDNYVSGFDRGIVAKAVKRLRARGNRVD